VSPLCSSSTKNQVTLFAMFLYLCHTFCNVVVNNVNKFFFPFFGVGAGEGVFLFCYQVSYTSHVQYWLILIYQLILKNFVPVINLLILY